MEWTVQGERAYAYTGGKPFNPALPCVVFVHGAQNDHSVWALQTRYFAHHGFSVLAVDLPGHGRSKGAPLTSVEAMADWLAAVLESAGVQLLAEIRLERIAQVLEEGRPRVAVVDSIQTLYSDLLQSAPGSVAQVRECAAQLTRLAKGSGIPLQPGDRMHAHSASGGGYGPPWERDPQRVLDADQVLVGWRVSCGKL